jgi:hypothetical protein
MLFFCELEMLEGHPKPKHDHAIIEADSREQASEKALRAFQACSEIDATYLYIDTVYLYEVPREQWAKIPTDLIDKRITKFVAEEFGLDCSLVLSYAARATLAKFPGPVTLQPSKQKWAGMFLLGLITAALGALPLLLLDPTGGWDMESYFWVGFFIVLGVLFMVLTPIALVKVRMTLDAAGFEMRSVGYTRRRHWKDVRFFSTAAVGPINMVAYVDSTRHGFWADVDGRFLSGPNALLVDSFGFTPDELAVLINAWRRRALSKNQ